MRNALSYVPKKQHAMVATIIRTAFVQESAEDAQTTWRETADQVRQRFEQNEEWQLTRRYMSYESLAKVVKPESTERLLEKQAVA